MKNFAYINSESLQEASKILQQKAGDSLIYAGGTDALSLLKKDIYRQNNVVNLKKIPGLDYIDFNPKEGLKIGALSTISELASNEILAKRFTIISEAANEIASPQLRNVGTIGGNLCQRPRCWYYREDFDCIRKGGGECYAYEGRNKFHCITGGGPCYIVHPSDLAVALLALEAKIVISSLKQERIVPIDQFYVLPSEDPTSETILKPGEIVKEIIVDPGKADLKSGYVKFKERGAWDFAIVSVGVAFQKTGNKLSKARVSFGGVAPKPWTIEEFNKKLEGVTINQDNIENVTKELFSDAEPLSENAYKIPLLRNLTNRLILKLS